MEEFIKKHMGRNTPEWVIENCRKMLTEWNSSYNEPSTFRRDLETLINKHSIENGSNTPDFILANYLVNCLDAFEIAVNRRTEWYNPK
jgi:hypothetical protein